MPKIKLYNGEIKFMVRRPIGTLKNYIDNYILQEKCSVEDLINDNKVVEAIMISSKSLYETIEKYKKDKKNDNLDSIGRALNKYFNRLTTRPTPYGLFSSVSIGTFGDDNYIKKGKYKKRARVDCEWLFNVMEILVFKEFCYKKVQLFTNNLLLKEGGKLKNIYPFSDEKSISNNIEKFYYIKMAKNIELVLDLAQFGVLYEDIKVILEKSYIGIPEEIIEKFLEELIKKEILVTELENLSENTNQLKYILKVLENRGFQSETYNKLITLDRFIDRYNNTGLGAGIELLEVIFSLMKEIAIGKEFLQVDLVSDDITRLNHIIKKELEKSLSAITLLRPDRNLRYLKTYLNQFLEKYGSGEWVQVNTLLDSMKGIGSPYPLKDKMLNSVRDDKLVDFIMNKIIESAYKNQSEIQLECPEIEAFKIDIDDEKNFSKSMEINFYIKSESDEHISNGDYLLYFGANGGSYRAGKTFGRFLDCLDVSANMFIEELNKKEESQNRDIEICELNTLNKTNRITNVTNNKHFRKYEINLYKTINDEKNKINIEDVYIGVEGSRFVAKSKKLNRKLDITTNHMLNNSSGNDVYRFLRDIGFMERSNALDFKMFLEGELSLKFIPRIKYGNLVIIPTTFRLDYNNIKSIKKLEVFSEYLFREFLFFGFQKICYLADGDNRILLNLENNFHLKYLWSELKKRKSMMVLQEFEGDIHKHWSEHNYEFVLPLSLNKECFEKIPIINKIDDAIFRDNPLNEENSNVQKLFLPGSEWLYIKIYYNDRRVDELLGENIYSFILDLKSKNLINKYFYIQYADQEKHIRLRLKIISEDKVHLVLKELKRYQEYLMQESLAKTFMVDSYDREIQRYGGESIEIAESLFEVDSSNILTYLNLIERNEITFDKELFACCSIIAIMEGAGIKYEKQLELFDKLVEKNLYRESFKEMRHNLLKFLNSSEDWEVFRKNEELSKIYLMLNNIEQISQKYFNVLEKLNNEKKLKNKRIDILLSLFHMHCNRLFGIDKEKEREVHALVRHTLYALKYFKQNRLEI